MSELDTEEVRRIARLARLELDPQAQALLRRQLHAILEYVALLDEVDTPQDGASATPNPGAGSEPVTLREDRPRPSLSRDDALANAPDIAEGHFRVPRVLD